MSFPLLLSIGLVVFTISQAAHNAPGSAADCLELENKCAALVGPYETTHSSSASDSQTENMAPSETQMMNRPDYIRTCRLEEMLIPCVRSWAGRCLAAGQADYFLETTSSMLQRCYDAESYDNYKAMFNCSLKLGSDAETVKREAICQEKLTPVQQVYSAPMISWGWAGLKQAIHSSTYQQDICCMVIKSLECGLDDIDKLCTPDQRQNYHDEAELTLEAFRCSDKIIAKCN